jgi:hypothetical protein
VASLLLAACGGAGGGGPAAPSATFAALDLSYAPDPLIALEGPAPGQWLTRFTFGVRETGGVGVSLTSIEFGVSTAEQRLRLDAFEIAVRGGTSRVEARAQVRLPIELSYSSATRAADLVVTVEGRDDRGNALRVQGGAPIR